MLIKELIEQDKQLQEDLKDEDTCGLCATHEAAYRVLEKNWYVHFVVQQIQNNYMKWMKQTLLL